MADYQIDAVSQSPLSRPFVKPILKARSGSIPPMPLSAFQAPSARIKSTDLARQSRPGLRVKQGVADHRLASVPPSILQVRSADYELRRDRGGLALIAAANWFGRDARLTTCRRSVLV